MDVMVRVHCAAQVLCFFRTAVERQTIYGADSASHRQRHIGQVAGSALRGFYPVPSGNGESSPETRSASSLISYRSYSVLGAAA
jgi:hypothetical protein